MGNRVSIQNHVSKEMDRLNELVNSQDGAARRFLTLDQLAKMQQLREQEIDLQHIGILFVLDKEKKGYFDEKDFLGLAEICLKNLEKWKEQNFQQQLQAYCTLQMWHMVCGSGGDVVFCKWFCSLLEASSESLARWDKAKRKRERDMGYAQESSDESAEEEEKDASKKKKGKKHRYVSIASVHVLHKLLMLEELYGLSKPAFVTLLLEVASEKKIPARSEYVPISVVYDFAFEFVRGLTRLMHRLGFTRHGEDK